MRELKRVLAEPRLWGLLALLLGVNLMLLTVGDRHSKGFYGAYCGALEELRALPAEAAAESAEEELAWLQKLGLLLAWQDADDPALREMLGRACTEAFADEPEAEGLGPGELCETALQGLTKDEIFLRMEALEELLSELRHIAEYPEFVEAVHENAERMEKLSAFSGGSGFAARNRIKTGRDFKTPGTLSLDNGFAVTMLATDELSGCALFVFICFIAMLLVRERRRGLWSLVHATPNGRTRLALIRVLILLACAALGVAAISGGKLLFAAVRYGGIGSLDRTVQSMAVFADFPYIMTLRDFLPLYFIAKTLGVWLMGLAVWAILQAVKQLPLAIAAAGAALAAEFSLYKLIPDSFSLVFLRYANVFALAELPNAALHYLNVNVFGLPVQGCVLTLLLMPPTAAALIAANARLASDKKPISAGNRALGALERLRLSVSRLAGRLRLLGMELYKLLLPGRGLAVLAALAAFAFVFMDAPLPDTALFDAELAGTANTLSGPIDEGTLASIENGIARYSSMEPTEAILRQLGILNRLKAKAEASLAAGDGAWLIGQTPYAALMGNADNYQRRNALVLLLGTVLLLGGLFASERENGMLPLLRAAPRGMAALWRKKLAAAFIGVLLLWLIFEAGELALVCREYGRLAPAATLQSFDGFAALPFKVSLGAGTAAYLLLRLAALWAAAGVMLLISAASGRTNTALLLGCAVLVLPVCLGYMGQEAADFVSFAKLLSPLEANAGGYAKAAAAGALCCGLSYSVFSSSVRRRGGN